MGLLEFLHIKKKAQDNLPNLEEQTEEIPVFNLNVNEEHTTNPSVMQNPQFQEGSKLLGNCIVYSNGLVTSGYLETLKTYKASLERYSDGSPANIHFNCKGHFPLDSSYPFRVFKDRRGSCRLTLLSIGEDSVYFGEKQHLKIA